MHMETEESLKEYLRLQLRVPLISRLGPLAKTFDFVATAAPGVKEILTVGKLAYEVRERNYDLVVVDASATGHVVGQLASPVAMSELVAVGVVRQQTEWMTDLLPDPATTGVVIVATPEEMPVNETLDLIDRLEAETDIDIAAVIANRVLPELFTRAEEAVFDRIDSADARRGPGDRGRARAARPCSTPRDLAVGLRRSRAVHLPTLRERLPGGLPLVYVPYLFSRGPRHAHHPHRGRAPRRGGALMARPRPLPPRPGIERLAATKEILISTGSGGVGKTTTAAAIGAMAAAHHGWQGAGAHGRPGQAAGQRARARAVRQHRDPGARLETFTEAGVEPRGELWAAMLDTKQSWDDLIRQHAPDPATRDAILANPLYQNITGKFIQSHDYVAMERLYEIHNSGRYDLIVVDTPPTRNAIDFLDAPDRMADFFSSRLLRWLIAPYRSRVVGLASKPFYSVADRILGSQFLSDIAEFFILFQSMYDGFVERAHAVHAAVGGRRARRSSWCRRSRPRRRARPSSSCGCWTSASCPSARSCSTRCCPTTCGRARRRPRPSGSPPTPPRCRRGAAAGRRRPRRTSSACWARSARTSPTTRWSPSARPSSRPSCSRHVDTVATVPVLPQDVADLGGLLRIGEHLWR